MPKDRHCTHCQSPLEYVGMKRLHEGHLNIIQTETMPCHVYLCRVCGHIEFFALIDVADDRTATC
jgi:RNase P subunit RPR2